MKEQPPQTHNEVGYDNSVKAWYFRVDDFYYDKMCYNCKFRSHKLEWEQCTTHRDTTPYIARKIKKVTEGTDNTLGTHPTEYSQDIDVISLL